MTTPNALVATLIALCAGAVCPASARADSRPAPPPPVAAPYPDLADLADGAPLVLRAQVRKLVPVEPARAAAVRPGQGRFYVEAKTELLYAGRSALGEALRYLVDLPLDAKGKPPALKKQTVLLFARSVPGRPGELQLVARDAQLAWNPASEASLKAILQELYAPGAPQKVTGVREVIHVPGNLSGEGETQLFLTTANGEPAAIAVSRSPGQPARLSVSFSEVLGEATGAPRPGTLAWYRLACFLPRVLPVGANISEGESARAAAGADYRYLLDQLGPCARNRK
ncbi:hypothetical protein [Novosphingobium sp. B 225]|uniref:hypothetical protein n=1 Tax=Novosphingobium sp. B 225 TaxID=1961849 RepID=UPI000B4ABDD0|nr:hypothetical protein [Novosphingobium sp. B 225]